ncbi:MAG: hypothetical protein QOI30_1806, partial [Mycobacterium sp.]|nr:hypothetical protein [Mycobacterium sp.]
MTTKPDSRELWDTKSGHRSGCQKLANSAYAAKISKVPRASPISHPAAHAQPPFVSITLASADAEDA